MGFFSDIVHNTTGSISDAVHNTSGSVVSAAHDPVLQSAVTFGINPTALPVYQATGVTPFQQAAIGAAAGGAYMAAPAVASFIPGLSSTEIGTAAAGLTLPGASAPSQAPAAVAQNNNLPILLIGGLLLFKFFL